MPKSSTRENKLLGGLLVGLVHWPGAVESSVSALESRHFGAEANCVVFKAVVALRRAGLPVDLVAVYGQLRRVGRVSEAGGAGRLADLWDGACHPADVPALAEALLREDRPEPPLRVYLRKPDPPRDTPDVDTSFDFGANAPP